MSSSQALCNRLFAYLREVHPDPHVKRISNWVWIMVGMILSHSVHLSQIAQYIPSEAEAAGRIAQIRRWLSNRFVDPVEFYRPLISQVLQSWAGQHVFILMDGLAVNNDKLQVLRVSLSHAYRALPLGWLVLKGMGPPTVEQAAPLLREVRQLLKALGGVTLIADRGFHDVDWAKQCLKYGWNYLIRVPSNTYVCLASGEWVSIKRLGVKRGQRRYFPECGAHPQPQLPLSANGHLDRGYRDRRPRAVRGHHQSAAMHAAAEALPKAHGHRAEL